MPLSVQNPAVKGVFELIVMSRSGVVIDKHIHISKISFNGTHIHVSLPPDEQVWYIGKSMIVTQNILTVYDLNMWFTCVHGAARSYA